MRVRGPGSIGTTSIGSLARHLILFSHDHTPRRFVERVDYVSVPGWRRRADAGLTGGPSICVTPLAVMDFVDGWMHLRSVHPGVDPDDVRDRTGFPLPDPGKVPVTLPPTGAERAALEVVDPFNRLDQVAVEPGGGTA